ncbi:MAG: hypothetical protein O7I42_10680 [Alphaproteobacteria bacterium]|nr:hypothetical protein [Alphaproteobacteria bacterium]
MEMRDTQPNISRARIPTGNTGRLGPVAYGLAVIAATFLFSAISGGRPASAQAVCGDHSEILAKLEEVHSEKPRAIAVSADGKLLEVVVSATGSWSILLTHPNRRTCVVATGDSWESLPVIPTGPSA